MKCSTTTMQAIQQLLIQEFNDQLKSEDEVHVDEMEQSLRTILQEIGQATLGEVLSLVDEQSFEIQTVCKCGKQGQRVSRRSAQLLSVFGWVSYRRSYYHCKGCGSRWSPLDEEHQLRPGRASRPMASLLGLAGITVSFEEAQRQIREYLQVEVSANTIRRETQRIGERQAKREQAWIEQSQELDYLQARQRQRERPKRVYGSIDGAFAPIEKEWKEAKLVSWYRAGERYGSSELCALDTHYYIDLEKAATFGDLLWATALEHQVDLAEEVVFVCDGAAWIWKLVTHNFPNAIQIVDWFHACQYLYPVAEALFDSQEQREEWVATMKALLWDGHVEKVIDKSQALLKTVGVPAQKLITYYSNNQTRMRYAHFRKQNYFIGSGTIESGCKQIVSMRLKRSGARWTKSGASATAKARAAWLNHDWHTVTNLPLAA